MKNIYLVILTFSFLTLNAQDSLTVKKIVIPEGTVIKVKSLTAFDSKYVSEGDMVDFSVFEDLEIEGKVLIKEGTIVSAYIESSEKAKGIGKEGSIKIQFNGTKAIDGSKVLLRSMRGTISGDGKAGTSIALAAVISPLFLLKKGKEAKITEGKIMEAYVSRQVTVTLK